MRNEQLFPKNAARKMVDLHMHVVPGVDDGSYHLDMSETLLVMAHMQGVRTVFATPHSFAFSYDPERVRRQFEALRDRMSSAPFDLRLCLGCEVRCEPDSMEQTLLRLDRGIYPTLNGTPYVLTEFRTSVLSEQAVRMVEQLTRHGWRPVIAHTERYPALFARSDTIDQILSSGSLLQINAYSLDDEPDSTVVARSRKLLSDGKVSFLGSDAHRLDHRPPSVRHGLAYLYAHCTPAEADAVCFGNAERLLLG